MPVVHYKPTTSARRHTSILKNDVSNEKPRKKLLESLNNFSGRNNQGKITVRHRGGGVKRLYRVVDFRFDRYDEAAEVTRLEYDPYRTARIALVRFSDGEERYILAPVGVEAGMQVMSSQSRIEINPGNRMPLHSIPTGLLLSNVEIRPGAGGKIARAAGTSVTLMAIEGDHALLKMASGEIRRVLKTCMATIGAMGAAEHRTVRIGKAGRVRRKGRRPQVRGKAMNPVDHPHGGGEGKHPIGMTHPKTPWGKPALGVPTRQRNKYSDEMIVKRRKK
jgi:large subunit ribosomal protein L2